VTCLIQLLDKRLCSGSYEKTIKVWSETSGDCELSIETGDYPSCIIQLRDERLCTGSMGGVIDIWDLTTRIPLHNSS
jgi:WD40 repeat protein